jgi:hypothetical protein
MNIPPANPLVLNPNQTANMLALLQSTREHLTESVEALRSVLYLSSPPAAQLIKKEKLLAMIDSVLSEHDSPHPKTITPTFAEASVVRWSWMALGAHIEQTQEAGKPVPNYDLHILMEADDYAPYLPSNFDLLDPIQY